MQQQTRLEVTESEIHVLAGGSEAEPATLNVFGQTNIDVWVNGNQVSGRCSITDADKIQVKVYHTPYVRTARVEVTPDGLQAMLHIQYESGLRRTLRPVAAAPEVRVVLEEAPLEPTSFDMAEIMELLLNQKITYQVDQATITEFLGRKENGACVCALGTAPVVTLPERYELLIKESNDVTLVGIMPIHPVVSVLEGTAIAMLLSRQEGTPGVNVYGEAVAPDPVASKLPNLGKGVERSQDGQVVASRAGRIISSIQTLDVAETLVIEGNLQVKDGYVVFDGDVVVRGDVEEGTEIVAGGKVFVSGAVSMATISSDGDIVISGGAFGSTLRAGLRVVAFARLSSLLSQLSADIKAFVGAVEQIQSTLLERGAMLPAGKIAAKLLDDRFESFRAWPRRIEEWLAEDGKATGSTWSKFAESLIGELMYQRMTSVRDVNAWKIIGHLLNNKIDALNVRVHEPADIQIRNGQTSNIQATGSIVSTNQGYYQCDMSAGTTIRAQGSPGAILACTVVAGEVIAREIGSQAEAHTTIQLLSTVGSVQATTVHPGTMFSVGTWRHKVPKEIKNVTWP